MHLKELRQENIYQVLYESKYEVLEFEIYIYIKKLFKYLELLCN
jgi:hypothetical protein